MKEQKTKIYEGRAARIVITTILMAVVAVSGALITKFDSVVITLIMIGLCVFGIMTQVIYTSILSTLDKKREIAIEEAVRQLESYKVLFDDLSNSLQDSSVGINKIARTIINSGEVQDDRWTFDNSSNVICEVIRKFIINQSVIGENIAVNYVKRHDEDENIIELVGCSNTIHEPPNSYRVPRNIHEVDSKCDAKMFVKNSAHRIIKLTPDEVDKVLVYNDREHDSGRIEQIAFVPVMCEKKKMVGLLELVAYKGTIIASTDAEMDKIVLKARILYTTLLLLQKSEKAALAIPRNV